jgi:hypothetical protein
MRCDPVLHMGQASLHLQGALTKLDSKLGFEPPPSKSFNQQLLPSNESITQLRRCCGYDMVCWDSSCSSCNKSRQQVRKSIRSLLEELDYLNSITLICDTSNQFDHWLLDTATTYLMDHCKAIEMHGIALRPIYTVNGLDAHRSTLMYSKMLTHCSSVTLRGCKEFFFEDEVEASRKTSGAARCLSMEDYYHWLGCDIWFLSRRACVAASAHPSYTLWPRHICSYPSKLVDVRSSLHRTLLKVESALKGSRKGADLVPHRLVSSSLHHLHLAYQHSQSHLPSQLSYHDLIWHQRLRMASMCSAHIDSTSRAYHVAPSGQDVPGLHWATKGLHWLVSEDVYGPFQDAASVGRKGTGLRLLDNVPLAIMSFESPYMELDIMNACTSTKRLLATGAFNHRLSASTGIAAEDLLDATLNLEECFS